MADPALPAAGDPGPGWTATLNAAVLDASRRADQALAQGTGVPAVVQVESFPGTTDAAKMSAALTYAAQQTFIPWVQLPARTFNTGTASFDWFAGMKICGAGYEVAAKGRETNANTVLGQWQTSCGTGANSLLRASTTISAVSLSNIQFYAPARGSQIVRASGGNGLYPSVFHNLSLYGGNYFFGNPGEKFLTTQMVFSGHWTVLGYLDTPFTLGGGDCSLWMSGYLNSNSVAIGGVGGGGKPIVDLQGMGKTDVGFMYLTNEDDWVGLRIQGGSDKGTNFFGGKYEGRSQSKLSTRPVIDIQGGSNHFYGPWLAQVDSGSGTVNGVIHQSGGTAAFHGGVYHRGAAASASFPLVYQTGGSVRGLETVDSVLGESIRWRKTGGTTYSFPVPSNGPTTLPAAATDAASTQALANAIRQALIDSGKAF